MSTAAGEEWRAALTTDWELRWPGLRPVGHEFRCALADRRVRFHTLPEGQRYATTASEHGQISRRHPRTGRPGPRHRAAPVHDLVVVDAPSTATDAAETPAAVAVMHGISPGMRTPHPGARWWQSFIEDEELSGVVIAPVDLRWLVAPYDGGMDVVTSSSADRDVLRDRYARWLRPATDGRAD